MSIFFFSSRRRHTRSLRDWSSDVCSSDLMFAPVFVGRDIVAAVSAAPTTSAPEDEWSDDLWLLRSGRWHRLTRSEERRVGKECRSRWWSQPEKKKIKLQCRQLGESAVSTN